MKKTVYKTIFFGGCCLLLVIFLMATCVNTKNSDGKDILETGFKTPPDSVKLSASWYWINGNISKEGVIRDLESMAKIGIGRVFIGYMGLVDPKRGTSVGKVKLFSDEWWDILHTALKTATELNLEIGLFNSPGFSQSGGPWIKPEQAMRYLASSELTVQGPQKLTTKLEKPKADFQDVKVIAFKAPKLYYSSIKDLKPKIKANPAIKNINDVIDGNQATTVYLKDGTKSYLIFELTDPLVARSVTIHPAHNTMIADVVLQIKEGSGYKNLKQFSVDRRNDNLNVGFVPYGPVVISIPTTESKNFRLVFSNVSPNFSIAEIDISASPKVAYYIEKTLAKMFQRPLPYWNEYQWPVQPVVEDKNLVINPREVRDISKYMATDGTLTWNVPEGNWVIMRTGMTPTGVKNSHASPEGTGLEVDKMSKKHVKAHFEAFLGEIMDRIPAEDRKTWKVAVLDSYETGGQNWTDGMLKKFEEHYGYDPIALYTGFGRERGGKSRAIRSVFMGSQAVYCRQGCL